jgi:NTP pyrophosphatase (non-canonical NTP hydrolase)
MTSDNKDRSLEVRILKLTEEAGEVAEAAAVAQRTYADQTGDSRAEFLRVCYPLWGSRGVRKSCPRSRCHGGLCRA